MHTVPLAWNKPCFPRLAGGLSARRKPTLRWRSGCSARAAIGHAAVKPTIPRMKSRRRIASLAINKRSKHEIEASEMGFDGQFCTAEICHCACRLGVKKRIHLFGADVSFHQVRTWRRRSLSRHSITLSAMASTPGGIVKLSIFAVLRLMLNSNLIGCSTGRLEALAPFNIRST
jgi:hypothetical protein